MRLFDYTLALDVDAYDDKTGGRTLKEAESRWGTLPPTYRNSARPDDPVQSGCLLYRVPEGVSLGRRAELPRARDRRHRTGPAPPPVRRGAGRSAHPKTGGVYPWCADPTGRSSPRDGCPGTGSLPELSPGVARRAGDDPGEQAPAPPAPARSTTTGSCRSTNAPRAPTGGRPSPKVGPAAVQGALRLGPGQLPARHHVPPRHGTAAVRLQQGAGRGVRAWSVVRAVRRGRRRRPRRR